MFASPSFPPKAVPTYVGNTGNAAVGAIRWDAWYHSSGSIREAVEVALTPAQYHRRLPFFADAAGSFTDNFGDASLGAQWETWGSASVTKTEQNGRMEFGIALNTQAYGGLILTQRVDFKGASVSCQVTSIGAGASTDLAPVAIDLDADSTYQLFWDIYGGNIIATTVVASVTTELRDDIAYNSSVHRYFRIRESAGTIYFDYSTDGSAWTNYITTEVRYSLGSALISNFFGTYGNQVATHAYLDDFSLTLSAGEFLTGIQGTQADMDAEIAYAVDAGLDYWAFFWYGVAASNQMGEGWDLFQASPDKADINWCLFFSGHQAFVTDVAANQATLTGYTQQSNYQKVLTTRPLVYIHNDGSVTTGLAAAVTSFSAALVAAGAGDPYFVYARSGTPVAGHATELTTYGFDALSKYAYGPSTSSGQPQPFRFLDAEVRNIWSQSGALAIGVVPIVMMGWDRRPRVENPVPWEGASGTLPDYYYPERISDIGEHLDAALKWTRDNPLRAVANTVIIYNWNEFDEGGWITPTLTTGSPNTSRVNLLAEVLS